MPQCLRSLSPAFGDFYLHDAWLVLLFRSPVQGCQSNQLRTSKHFLPTMRVCGEVFQMKRRKKLAKNFWSAVPNV